MSIPIIINTRDRVTVLRQLVDWLEKAGHDRIIFLDNASTYEPLLEYFKQTPHTVQRLKVNGGARGLWDRHEVPAEWFVYTDPDVVPIDECPLDAVNHFYEILQRHPSYSKAGFGLYLEDVPAHMHAMGHEKTLMDYLKQVERRVYDSAIDTTFALCRPGIPWFDYRALRTGMPYMARHLSIDWYEWSPTEEDRYYYDHAEKGDGYSSGARQTRLGP